MSTKALKEVLYYMQGIDFDRATLSAARAELAAHEVAHAALRRLLNAFSQAGTEEEFDAVREAQTALATLKALEDS